MDDTEINAKLTAYGRQFLTSYTNAIDTNFPAVLEQVRDVDLDDLYFPLYNRSVGDDTSLAMLFTTSDFYLFFLAERDTEVAIWIDADAQSAFSRDWTFNTPGEMRVEQVRDELGISIRSIICVYPGSECVNAPGTNLMADSIELMTRSAQDAGTTLGNQAGARAQGDLPQLLSTFERSSAQTALSGRYSSLRDSSVSAQVRGQEFEKLWRDVLDFHGWRPKKIRIPGEENDFTAIYQGHHILGEGALA